MVADDKTASPSVIEFEDFSFNVVERRLYRHGEPVRLTPKPLSALAFLIENRDRAVTKEELLAQVWGGLRTTGTVEQAISYLRKALDDDPAQARYIETIPGQGYRWIAKVGLPSENRPAVGNAVPGKKLRSVGAGLTAAILGCLLIVFVLRHFAAPEHVARVALNGDTLVAMSATNRVLWNYVFENPLREGQAEQAAWRTQVVDLDGDGDPEVIVAADYKIEAHGPHELYCFSSRGKVLWRYLPRPDAEFRTKDLNGPWLISQVLVVPDGKSSSIWLAVNHAVWWPSFLVRLSPDGGARIMFVSSGLINGILRFKNDSGSYILAVGVNNEYRSASLAVIAENGPPATSPQSANSAYECVRNCPAGKPYRYFLLPRSELNAASKIPYNRGENIFQGGDGVTVEVTEIVTGDLNPSVNVAAFYGFSRELRPTSVAYGDSYAGLHKAAEALGWIRHSFDKCPERTTRAVVKVADASGNWSEVLVPRTQY